MPTWHNLVLRNPGIYPARLLPQGYPGSKLKLCFNPQESGAFMNVRASALLSYEGLMNRRIIPNSLTSLRIIITVVLWFYAFAHDNMTFAFLYLAAGITDLLDGWSARKLGVASEFGQWFDSLADNLMSVSLPFWIWFLIPEAFSRYLIAIIVLLIFFILNMSLGFLKFHKMLDFHLYSSKIAAIMTYVFFLWFLLFGLNDIVFYFSAAVGFYTFSEELVIMLRYKKIPSEISHAF